MDIIHRPNALANSEQDYVVVEVDDKAGEIIGSLCAQVDALQARIDALMLEFCPDEMNEEQLENWARHQRPASDEVQAAYQAARSNVMDETIEDTYQDRLERENARLRAELAECRAKHMDDLLVLSETAKAERELREEIERLRKDLETAERALDAQTNFRAKIARLRAESAENERLRDALDHIMRVARSARQPTRRLDWIAERARRALDGKPYDQGDMPQYPKTRKDQS